MECFTLENLSFQYPEREEKALDGINIKINCGEFVTVIGSSGSGKTTLLRLLKPSIAPFGKLCGQALFMGIPINDYSQREESGKIGFVMQDPDSQIVTDKVWHELAFGLEGLGVPSEKIRARVAEMASFFGIQSWFHKNVSELSGGQKQLLNLASVMAMQPQALILDEPTSQLDPIAAGEFMKTLEKINRELGTTVVLSEHRLDESFAMSDKVIAMENGKVVAIETPEKIGNLLSESRLYEALPVPIRIFSTLESEKTLPVTVRDGRYRLEEYSKTHEIDESRVPQDEEIQCDRETVIEINDAWFAYDKTEADTVRGLNLSVKKGEFYVILGGNGTGKTTTLGIIAGLNRPYRGTVKINSKRIENSQDLYNGSVLMLPQNPESVFLKKTVLEELYDALRDENSADEEKNKRIADAVKMFHLDKLLSSHPYDLSGGERQRAALAKIMLKKPEILLLDEPTKGIDAHFKAELAKILLSLKNNGVTIVMVSHDVEFAARYADRCAMFFDGGIISCEKPREFFSDKSFYTTAASRMSRGIISGAVLPEDVVLACGKTPKSTEVSGEKETEEFDISSFSAPGKLEKNDTKLSRKRCVTGIILSLFFILAELADTFLFKGNAYLKGAAVLFAASAILTFFPQKSLGKAGCAMKINAKKLNKRTALSAVLILLMIPLTIYVGVRFWGDRKYYLISLLIIFETMIPFFMVFEGRRPEARELIIISVLSAIAIAGRAAFFSLQQFKPVVAIVIISGICFGGETGFLVGAVTGFVSNFFFGQGPWTPWQMFSFGIIGFISGLIFSGGVKKSRISLAVFGFLATLLVYGGIMNPASLIMARQPMTKEMLLAYYAAGFPLDLIHASSTAFFLWFLAEPMIDKLERVKIKYGLIERDKK